MRVYRVEATIGGTVVATRYGSTAADGKAKRDELMAKFGASKKEMTVEQVEIPTAKADLLLFINELSAKADAKMDEDEKEGE